MWGNVFYSNDFNELMFAQQNNIRVVVLDDDRDRYKRFGCYPMGILLPPFDALDAELNGDFVGAKQIYFAHLQSQYCSEAFAAIFTALYAGKDLMFYISSDEARNLEFSKSFLEFLANVFGVIPGSITYPNTGAISNQSNHLANRLNVMYITDNIPFEVYAREYPKDLYPDLMVCQKIAYRIIPNSYGGLSPEQLQQYCYNYMISYNNAYSTARKSNLTPSVVVMNKE